MFESEKAAVDFSKQVTAHLWARQFLGACLQQGQSKFYFHWSSALSVCITTGMETELRGACPEFCSLKQISSRQGACWFSSTVEQRVFNQQNSAQGDMECPGSAFLMWAWSAQQGMHQINEWDLSMKGQRHCQVFPLQVCIAKCNSSPALDSVLCQDLLLGEGQGVEAGDSLEVAYTGWLFQNNGLGQVKTFLPPPNAEWDSPWKEPAHLA